jgi:hypothetical protein
MSSSSFVAGLRRGRIVAAAAAVMLAVASLPGPVATAAGAIVFDGSPGTNPPPATLGGYPMISFGPDGLAAFSSATSVPAPGGRVLSFSPSVAVRDATSGRSGWTAGYTGHVYGDIGPVVLSLPAGTRAIYLYAEHFSSCPSSPATVTVTADGGVTSGPVPIGDPCGPPSKARYFGFYTTAGAELTTLTVSFGGALGIMFGQFGISYARTPGSEPAAVTVAGSLQTEVGCAGDWDPACTKSQLAYDANSAVWKRSLDLPAGDYAYKGAIDDSWDENYGLHAVLDGANIPLSLASGDSVTFYYDDKTHWVTDDMGSVIATAAGDFQSELGCAGDWDPSCLRSWLEDPSGSGTYTFTTTTLPAGAYEAKVAIDESWDENYGQGGVPNGANIGFTVPAAGRKVVFAYDPISHVLSIVVDTPRLSLATSASPATYTYAGQSITYTFVATNTGNVALAGPVTITDDRLGSFACSSIVSLAPGASVTCTRTYLIRAGDVSPLGTGSVTDHATASAAFAAEPVVSDPSGTTILQAVPKPTDPPHVLSFSPVSGRSGATVTISGTSFTYVRSVTFNGVAAVFSVRSGTTIVATVPAGATTGPIRVTTPFGSGASRTGYFILP